VFKGPISATGSYCLKGTTQTLKDETQAYVTAVYKAVQWIKASSPDEITKALERYSDTMGLAPEVIRKALDWYKPVWTYDLVFTRENYDNVNNVAKGIKAEKTYPYEEIVDLSFLRKASGSA
jgi:sulfonate transport system substrate-binding protein